MTGAASLLLVFTLTVAVIDWAAVVADKRPVEYVAKPLTLVLLIATALALDPVSSGARVAFVVALVFCLAGDVFLMLPDRERWFVFGLGAFLVGHLAYLPGLWLLGIEPVGLIVGFVIVLASVALVGRRVVAAVQSSEPRLAVPVTAYLLVISAMVVSAFGTLGVFAIAGALSFYASDAILAWNAFVRELSWGRPAVMVTYHLGQVGLVLALITT